jgi:hypothetical protein
VTTRARIAALPDTPIAGKRLKDSGARLARHLRAEGHAAHHREDRRRPGRSPQDPAVTQRLSELGAEMVPESKQTPAGLRDWLRAEIDKWTPVIRSAGISAD